MLSYWGSTLKSSASFLPEPEFCLTVCWEMLLFCCTRSRTLLLSKLCSYLLSLRWNWRSRGSFSWLCYCYLLPQTQKNYWWFFKESSMNAPPPSPLHCWSVCLYLRNSACSPQALLTDVLSCYYSCPSYRLSGSFLLQIHWNMQDSCASYLQLTKTPPNLVTWNSILLLLTLLRVDWADPPLIWPELIHATTFSFRSMGLKVQDDCFCTAGRC